MNRFGKLSAALVLLGLLPFGAQQAHAQDGAMQPFVMAEEATGDVAGEIAKLRQKLEAAGFEVIGSYQPYEGAEVLCVTSAALKAAAAASKNGGFAAVMRVAVTTVGGKLQASYQNPSYLAAAYRLGSNLGDVAAALKTAIGASQSYGTAKGRSAKELADFHYMVGMEYFTDFYDLAKHKSYEEAVKTVEANLAKKVGGAAQVYKLELPGKQITVFGVSRAAVTDQDANEKHIMADTVDREAALKTTAYLPYEIVVDGKDVRAMHMRFRMSVWHPDLTMGTFGKLMASPGAIEKLLKDVAGGKKASTF